MKIHQIIKEKRISLGLTQEQIAEYLGISTPAVNKWEKGTSYPDITFLPPLARLLKVDLNTLLSFEDDLSDKEIALIVNEIASTVAKDGFLAGYEKGMDYIHKYPTCHKLLLNVAMVFQGSLYMYAPNEADSYKEEIQKLYERCLESEDIDIRYQTISMLTTNYINAKQFDRAQEFLDKVPNVQFDKKLQQGLLYIKRKEFDSALKLYESELVSAANKINTILMIMVEIFLKQEQSQDAKYLADVAAKSAELFDLWDYNKYANYFQLYCAQKDSENCVKTLKEMLAALEKPWDISASKLYKHIDKKTVSSEEYQQMVDTIINMLKTNPDGELDFMEDNLEFKMLMQKYTN